MSIIPKYYLSWISQRFNNTLVIFYIVSYLQLKAIVLIVDYHSFNDFVCVCVCVCVFVEFPYVSTSGIFFVFDLYLTQFIPFVRGVGKCWLSV